MKTLRIVSVLALAALVGTGTACDRNLAGLNNNPNGPLDAPPPSILPTVIENAVDNGTGIGLWSVWINVKLGGVFSQQMSELQYRDEEKYILRSDAMDNVWGLYNGPLNNAQTMIQKGIDAKNPNWEAVGRILKAWLFGISTDYFGDIPYSEALQGTAKLTPKYDKQKDIYAGNFADLAKAGSIIDPSGAGFASGDLLYGGDMTKWKKFAYSLMLRDALHLSNADPITGAAMAKQAVQGGVFESNDDNAQLMYLSASPNQNPIYVDRYVDGRDDFGMGKALVDTLSSLNDPRLPIFAQPNDGGTYAGLPPGLNDGEGPAISTVSRIGALWRETGAAPMPLMTYAEVLLLEAEAVQRGWITPADAGGSAAQLYTDAITASMEEYGVSSSAISAYLAQPRVQYNAAGGLSQIAVQKWIALFMNGIETFTELRRTDIPHIVPGPEARLTSIPTRIPYPPSEEVLNKASLDAAISAQGLSNSADMSTPLWFAKH